MRCSWAASDCRFIGCERHSCHLDCWYDRDRFASFAPSWSLERLTCRCALGIATVLLPSLPICPRPLLANHLLKEPPLCHMISQHTPLLRMRYRPLNGFLRYFYLPSISAQRCAAISSHTPSFIFLRQQDLAPETLLKNTPLSCITSVSPSALEESNAPCNLPLQIYPLGAVVCFSTVMASRLEDIATEYAWKMPKQQH
jgi:hypothetical protein